MSEAALKSISEMQGMLGSTMPELPALKPIAMPNPDLQAVGKMGGNMFEGLKKFFGSTAGKVTLTGVLLAVGLMATPAAFAAAGTALPALGEIIKKIAGMFGEKVANDVLPAVGNALSDGRELIATGASNISTGADAIARAAGPIGEHLAADPRGALESIAGSLGIGEGAVNALPDAAQQLPEILEGAVDDAVEDLGFLN